MVPGTIFLPVGLFIFGWCAEKKVQWVATDIGLAFVGAGIVLNFQTIQTYVIDAFTLHAASAVAAVAFLRSLAGFGLPLFAPAMYDALGYGKGDTILACFAIVVGCPALALIFFFARGSRTESAFHRPWFFWKYGETIRKKSRYAAKT